MLNLFIKDILVQKKQMLFSFFYILFFIFVFQHIGSTMFSGAVVAFVYMLVANSCANDDKTKVDVLLNSLPVKRNTIVFMKYFSAIVYFCMASFTYFIFTSILMFSGLSINVYPLTTDLFLGGFAGVVFLMGIFYPIYFKVGYMKSRIVTSIIFFCFFFGLVSFFAIIKTYVEVSFLVNMIELSSLESQYIGGILIMLFVVLFLIISYKLSASFYNKREF